MLQYDKIVPETKKNQAPSRVFDQTKIARNAAIPPKTNFIINIKISASGIYPSKVIFEIFLISPGFALQGIIEGSL